MTRCEIVDEDGVVQATCTADDVFRLLADRRRREVVTVLDRLDDERIERERLLSALRDSTGEPTPTEWDVALRHVHLPMLEDVGLVEYDADDGTIRRYRCELVSAVLSEIESD